MNPLTKTLIKGHKDRFQEMADLLVKYEDFFLDINKVGKKWAEEQPDRRFEMDFGFWEPVFCHMRLSSKDSKAAFNDFLHRVAKTNQYGERIKDSVLASPSVSCGDIRSTLKIPGVIGMRSLIAFSCSMSFSEGARCQIVQTKQSSYAEYEIVCKDPKEEHEDNTINWE